MHVKELVCWLAFGSLVFSSQLLAVEAQSASAASQTVSSAASKATQTASSALSVISGAEASQPAQDQNGNQVLPWKPVASTTDKSLEDRSKRIDDRARELRNKCRAYKRDTMEKYMCERIAQVDLQDNLAQLLKDIAGKQSDWPGLNVAAEQQAWLKQRDACANQPELKMCLEFAYLERIATLQAQFDLMPKEGPVKYACHDYSEPLLLTFVSTNPPLVVRQRGDQRQIAWMHPTSGGDKFEGEQFVFHEVRGGGELIQDGKTYSCVQQP